MPASDFDSEALLTFVSELDKRVADLKKEISSLGEVSSASMKKAGDQAEEFGDAIEKNIKPLKGLTDQSSGLTRALTGAVGIGTAFYGASKALEQFVVSGLQLRNFATDVGLSTAAVGKFQSQLAIAGIDAKTANQQLGALAAHLDDIKTYDTASQTYKAVAANDPILAKRLLDAERAGDRLKSFQWIKEKWAQPGEPRSKLFMGETLGVNQSTMQALLRNTEGLIQPRQYTPEQLEEYNVFMWNALTISSNAWGAAMQFMVEDTNKFIAATKREFQGLGSWFQGVRDSMKKEGGTNITGPKGFFPSLDEITDLIGKGAVADTEAIGSGLTDGGDRTDAATFDERFGSGFAQRFGSWKAATPAEENIFREKFDLQKNSYQYLVDIRDLLRGESGGPAGVSGAGYGTDGDGKDNGPGGQAGVRDEAGNPIDQETMKLAESLGRSGDVAGLQRLFTQRGYRMSGAACGIVASKYARAAGFEPPKSGAIATSWHKWGEQSSAEDVNKPDRPMGSIMGTYYHRRYGGNPNELLRPGATGGHVMTIVPGSFDPKTGTVGVVDQYGFKRRSIKDIDFRYAGDQAVKEAERIRKGQGRTDPDESRKRIDSSFPGMRKDKARIDVEFNGTPKGVKTDAELLDQGVFNTLNIRKSPASQPVPN